MEEERQGKWLRNSRQSPTSWWWFAFAGLTAFGIRQTIVYGVGLELIPGPVLLLAAFELYRRRDQMKPDSSIAQAAQPAY